MYYKPTEFNQNRWSHCWENQIFLFFLMWTTLNFRVRVKTKNIYSRYLREDPRYRFWTRLMSWFRPCVTRRKKNLKDIFPVSGNFPGKAESVILLGFECSINIQNLIKIVGAIFEKIYFFYFFLCELPLILELGGKLKKARAICERTLDIDFERDRSIGLGCTFGDGQTDRQTDKHTHRHFF